MSAQFPIPSSGNETFNQLLKNAKAENQDQEDSSRYSQAQNQLYGFEESKEKRTFNIYNDID